MATTSHLEELVERARQAEAAHRADDHDREACAIDGGYCHALELFAEWDERKRLADAERRANAMRSAVDPEIARAERRRQGERDDRLEGLG